VRRESTARGGWGVYILRCADGTFYTGCAKDPAAREAAHNAGRGAKYTAGRRPVRLVYSEACGSVGAALRRERELKRLTRARKAALVARAIYNPAAPS
jgi:predicted GIY-YIG superfamily endonuclease